MAQGTPQFSPSQVLEAGRRAEAEGKFDYAVQFYRHLVTHFASTPEASVAREGLDRIERSGSGTSAPASTASPVRTAGRPAGHAPATPTPSSSHADTDAGTRSRPYLNGADPHPYSSSASSWPGPGPSAPFASAGGPTLPPRTAEPHLDPGARSALAAAAAVLPPEADHYRMGRWLARLLSAAGWLMLVGGLGLLGAAPYVGQLGIGILNLLTSFGPTPLGVVAAAGLWLVFTGQRARAAFDTANSARELAAIARARFERQAP